MFKPKKKELQKETKRSNAQTKFIARRYHHFHPNCSEESTSSLAFLIFYYIT